MLFNVSHVWVYLTALARRPQALLAFVPLVVYVVTTNAGLPFWNAIGIDDNQVAWLHLVSFMVWPIFAVSYEGPLADGEVGGLAEVIPFTRPSTRRPREARRRSAARV